MPLAGPLRFPGTRCPGEQGPGPFHDLVRPTLCFCWPWAFLLSTGLTAKPMSFLGLALGRVTRRDHPLSSPQGPLLRWLKVNFSEAFIAWIHIKALRVFVESVLSSPGSCHKALTWFSAPVPPPCGCRGLVPTQIRSECSSASCPSISEACDGRNGGVGGRWLCSS